ncbi:sulfurtransferase [Spiribacter vilamensis]|uniref:Thiosulfate/3-mercaptopyruvate sulfurtransferase n=1 Tax=Spiribacter vilamensis TaxID=531306 RepID=A0A4Q8D214_9GAMM|nr:rhodanese-like domain-containing protein [Spiribacter vilamensis]RZU99383.1 thiosulfate/3-mercaptopyruvate sulfurtransferase [Spiribacter vilamensis]TVO61638.1 sulfurtransferase [Spiribacter vilamensis]
MRVPELIPVALLGVAIALPGAAVAQTTEPVTVPGPVVDADWALDHEGGITLINVSRRPSNYDATGFVDGAPFVGMSEFMTERPGMKGTIRYLAPSPERFETVMQGLGVDDGDAIVIAPAGDKVYGDATAATRLYWQLKYLGHDNVALLDGGAAAWDAAGGQVSDSPGSSAGGTYTAGSPRDALFSSTEDVEAVIDGEQSAQLVDNRPLAQFTGQMSKDYVDGSGYLPGARPVPFTLFVESRDGVIYWRSPESAREIVSAMLPGVDGPMISYCNSGHVSSLAWFGMSEIADLPDVSLYDGSLHEWTLDGDRSLVIGE